jgi:predicted phosphodiesterase
MRLLVTADLHFNHRASRPIADELIGRMNQAGGDVLLVIGDTACGDGDALEHCLSQFQFRGPRLFIAGNHELWTNSDDSYALFHETLPKRVRALGWHWLESEPFVADDVAIVGTIGWYDYSFAQKTLGIPRRFYERKISPGAAERFEELSHLFTPGDDVSPTARQIVARWNDGRHVKLGRSDADFVGERLADLATGLQRVAAARHIVAACHHVPLRELLPPSHSAQWDFSKAFLGSERFGELLLRHANVRHILCGHSHLPVEARVGAVHAINIGSGYRWKTFRQIDF